MRRSIRQNGFTLIEVLVVLVIVAIITAVAVMAFGDFGRGRNEKIRAETFGRMVRAAQSQAILMPAVLGLIITPKGYKFYQWVSNQKKPKWIPLSETVLSRPNAFADWFDVHVKGIAHYDPVDDSSGKHPAIIFLPSGYVTAFDLDLKGKAHHFLVKVINNGNVKIKT